MVFVCLDYGRKRIGVAVSTPLKTVHPRPRLERRALESDLEELEAIAREAGAEAFVIGLPHHMDGTLSEMEEEAREFAAKLAGATGLPVYGADERLTTEAAETVLRQAHALKGRARKERRDSAAACIVLQDFLDQSEEKRERIA